MRVFLPVFDQAGPDWIVEHVSKHRNGLVLAPKYSLEIAILPKGPAPWRLRSGRCPPEFPSELHKVGAGVDSLDDEVQVIWHEHIAKN
jgi:hypothetical protein